MAKGYTRQPLRDELWTTTCNRPILADFKSLGLSSGDRFDLVVKIIDVLMHVTINRISFSKFLYDPIEQVWRTIFDEIEDPSCLARYQPSLPWG